VKYFIISVAVAGIYLSMLPGKQAAGRQILADDKPAGICMANLSAGASCQPATPVELSQQKYVLVRGQLLPL
jgi:hypothetical protein